MKLFEHKTIGSLELKNSMVMAPMTRSRATVDGIPTPMMIEYYKQRSSAGLIISEGINISEQAIGNHLTPGIYNEEQIYNWKKVTEAVHLEGGKIVAQLWHTGRIGHSVDKKGALPVAPSPIGIKGSQHFTSQGLMDYETPTELSVSEIQQIISDYHLAAKNAIEAGFDGVELHAANGYLPNQFLSDSANLRTDEYGGSVENKCRFVIEVLKSLISAVGKDKVGIKISPLQPYGDIVFDDPIKTFTHLIKEINKLDIAFVEYMKRNLLNIDIPHYPKEDEIELLGSLVETNLIANSFYNKETGEAELQKGIADLIEYGQLFIANPDLPRRFLENSALNEVDYQTFFGGGEKGYTDYPTL